MRWLGYRNRGRRLPTVPRRRAWARRGWPVASVAVALIAIAPSWAGTTGAHPDPNRHGVRTVDAAGGGTTGVVVRFTVRPVVLLVASDEGALEQVWTNLRSAPTPAQLDTAVVRLGNESGAETALTPRLLVAARRALSDVAFGTPGLVWPAAG